MKNRNRILSLFLVLALCMSLLPFPAFADGESGICPPHTPGTVYAAQPSTCFAAGHMAYSICTVCGAYLDEAGNPCDYASLIIPPTAHQLSVYPATASTCSTAGHSEYWQCVNCGTLFADAAATDETTLEALSLPLAPHTGTPAGAVTPTCGSTGLKAHFTCSVCGTLCDADGTPTTMDALTLPKTEHSWGQWETVQQPTQTAPGQRRRTCMICGEVQNEQIPASGTQGSCYVVEIYAAAAGDCYTQGNLAGYKLSDGRIVLGTTSHTVGDPADTLSEAEYASLNLVSSYSDLLTGYNHASLMEVGDASDSTCLVAAKHYWECSICHKHFTDSTASTEGEGSFPLAPHTGTPAGAVTPTCGATGLKAHFTCSVCGKLCDADGTPTTMDALTLPKTNAHDWGQWETVQQPTQTAPGQRRRICVVCGEVQNEQIPALPAALALNYSYLVLSPTETALLAIVGLDPYWADKVEVVWSSDNESVVTVYSGIVAAVEDAEGTAWITASVEIDGNVLFARCRVDVVSDKAGITEARLPVTKATVELYSTAYTEIPVQLVLGQNLSGTDSVDGTGPLTMPPVDSAAAIERAEFLDTATASAFDLRVKDDRTLLIVPKPGAVDGSIAVKSSCKSAIRIYVEGESFETSEKTPLVITVKKTLPKLKAAAVKLNSYIPGDTQPIVISGGTVTGLAIDSSKKGNITWAELNGMELTYRGAANKGMRGKLNLLADVEGWAVPVPVAVSVSAVNLIPKLSFHPASLTLKPGTGDTAKTEITVSPADYADSEITVSRVTEGSGKNQQTFKADEISGILDVQIAGGMLTVRPGSGIDASVAHTYKVMLSIEGKEYPVTVKTLPTKTAVSLSVKAAGMIDTGIPNSPITLKVTPKNVHAGSGETYRVRVTKLDSKNKVETDVTDLDLLNISISGNVITLTERTPGSLEKGYTYFACTSAELGGIVTTEVKTKLTVKWSDPAKVIPSATLKAMGFVDVIRPGSVITVTPTVKNCFTYAPKSSDLRIYKQDGKTFKGDVTDKDENPFLVEVKNGIFTLKQVKPIDHRTEKFKVALITRMDGHHVVSAQIAVAVKMGTAKIAQDVKAVTLLKDDCHDRASLRLTPEAGLSEIADVTIISPNECFTLLDLGGGEYAIAYKESKLPTGFTGGTVKLQVFLAGNRTSETAKPIPNATLSVSVKLN